MLVNHQSMHLPLCRPSARLSVRLDKELAINLALPVNLILHFMVFSFPCFSIGTEKVVYFSVFYRRHSNWPSNSPTSSLISWSESRISFSAVYLKLHILCTGALYLPVQWQ